MLTDEQIRELLTLDERATKGPWDYEHVQDSWSDSHVVGPINRKPGHLSTPIICETNYKPDGDLIAAYRTACPDLAREVLRLREAVSAYLSWCNGDDPAPPDWYSRFRDALAGREWNDGGEAK